MRIVKGNKADIRMDMDSLGTKRGADKKQAFLDNSESEHEGGDKKFLNLNFLDEVNLSNLSPINMLSPKENKTAFSFVEVKEGSIQYWANFLETK